MATGTSSQIGTLKKAGFSSPQSQAKKRKILLSLREDIMGFTEVNSNPEIESKLTNLMKPHFTLWSSGCCILINASQQLQLVHHNLSSMAES